MHQCYDYLYVDRRRITSYFEQLEQGRHSEHPTQCPGKLQRTGTSRLTSRASSVCSSDLYRKAAFVLDCLKRNDNVGGSFSYRGLQRKLGRDQQVAVPSLYDPLDRGLYLAESSPPRNLYHSFRDSSLELVPFVHTCVQATKVLFPVTLDPSSDNSGIAVWLYWNPGASDDPEVFSNLANVWILENLSASDVDVRLPQACRYSALEGMIAERACEFSRTVLSTHQFVRDLKNMTFIEFQITHGEILSKLMFEKSVEVAVQLGGRIAWSAGEVEVFCRVRDLASYAGMGTHVYAQAVFVRTTQ